MLIFQGVVRSSFTPTLGIERILGGPPNHQRVRVVLSVKPHFGSKPTKKRTKPVPWATSGPFNGHGLIEADKRQILVIF